MKKNIINLTLLLIINIVFFSCATADIKTDDKILFQSKERGIDVMYKTVNGELIIMLWIEGNEKFGCVYKKYKDGHLIDLQFEDIGIKKIPNTPFGDDTESSEYIFGNNIKLLLEEIAYWDSYKKLIMMNGNSKKNITDNYFVFPARGSWYTSGFYADYKNTKFYFAAIQSNSAIINKDNYKFASDLPGSMYVYDILKGKISPIAICDIKQSGYSYPIRIPNTQYLMYFLWINTILNNKDFYDKEAEINSDFKIFIKEISEWKAEIELQIENKKKHPEAKEYFIDGPANIRETPNGKTISILSDWIKVLILEQKSDWYHILYADIDGWTHKKNLKNIEKENTEE